ECRGREIFVQGELLELQSNVELKPKLAEGYQQFWLQKQVPILYPVRWAMARKAVNLGAFSVVADLVTKRRSPLQLVTRGDQRLHVTSLEPNIDKLVHSQLCQPAPQADVIRKQF
ncbi:LOW QUALITY PROTEIN: hypothetical protein M514_08329, partial [Trichuris suis]